MVFGFGFSKAKALASAEKNVKAGKLQNAIADYEKILKEDPKDLTVLNTVGDLYARVGKSDKATEYFRKVGEVYVRDGFTVKAIAMYKKLTKQDPSALDAVQKLAELYTQQGLYTDARSQYMQLAEINMRNRELSAAAEMFKRILDLDPENYGLQRKLAEIYTRIGKKEEARDLYFRNAVALRTKSSLQDADDALGKCLDIDPKFSEAIQLRGQVRIELGDADGAVQALEQLPDIDSRPEALRALLNAYLKRRNLAEAEPVARKLLKVFSDVSGIADYADALISGGECEKALEFYRDHADQLFMANMAKGTEVLQSTIARVKSNTNALRILAELFQRSGNTGNFVEVTELLAHAFAASGDTAQAAELYRKLIELEPDNPQHTQNFRQVTGGAYVIPQEVAPTAQEAAGTSAEDISTSQNVEQKYPLAIQEAIQAAITDAELFESYNLPAKAIPPLEAALKTAPRDVRLNFKLVTLYARCGKLREAVQSCETLQSVYLENGLQKDAEQFGALAAKYRTHAGLPSGGQAETKAFTASASKDSQPTPKAEQAAPRVEIKAAASPVQATAPQQAKPEQVHEFDLSDEWEQMVEVEAVAETTSPHLPATAHVGHQADVQHDLNDQDEAGSETPDLLEEIRFYISQGMWREARAAFDRLEKLAPDLPELASLRAQLAGGETRTPSSQVSAEPGLISHAAPPQPSPKAPPRAAASDDFGSFVADLENSLGSDFNIAPAHPGVSAAPAQMPPAAVPAAAEVPPPSLPQPADEPSMLGSIFTDFKESMESGSDNHEDPETHYNLGVAFKEMGLLDEAIGELQKVCQAIERGHDFSQAIQAYTWLADAFLQKGVPEAAVRWYEKALKGRQVDAETATAIHYELACACEAAGDRSAALKHFMEVYGNNIDYRDVAERIKVLKS
jgi:tetratricopeptide (TPR) repeat protein